VKYTERGGITLRVAMRTSTDSGRTYEVVDVGCHSTADPTGIGSIGASRPGMIDCSRDGWQIARR
jgi:hypothetical protein